MQYLNDHLFSNKAWSTIYILKCKSTQVIQSKDREVFFTSRLQEKNKVHLRKFNAFVGSIRNILDTSEWRPDWNSVLV